jgi:hypothetical protein
MNMIKKKIKAIGQIALVALGASTLVATGCSNPSDTVISKNVIVGLDASGSARPSLGAYAALTVGVTESLTPDTDTLSLYRVDREAHLFSTGKVNGESEALLRTITAEVKPLSVNTRTFPATFWQEAAGQVMRSKTDTYIYFFTDGDNDDFRPTSHKAMQTAAKQMAGVKNLKAVVICGVQRGNWEAIRKDLAPLRNRLYPIFANEMEASKVVAFLEK